MTALALALVWTNLAGTAISAEPLRVAGGRVVMVRRDGAVAVTNALPLAAFPVDEQRRIRRTLGEWTLPPRASGQRAIFASDLARAEALTAAGVMSAERLALKRQTIARAWAHELARPENGLSPEEIEHWKEHLK